MTPLDTNAEAYVVAAFRWAMRDDRFDEVRKCVNRLHTSGEVLSALQVCRDLACVLERRHHEIVTRMLSDLEVEMVAAAALTPDALPDDIGDGFAINGRHTLPQRVTEPCAYCGKEDCDERFDHERADAANETTWMRRART